MFVCFVSAWCFCVFQPPAHDQALRELAQHCQRACKMQHYTPKLLYLIVIGCIVAIVAQLFPILFESGEDMGEWWWGLVVV